MPGHRLNAQTVNLRKPKRQPQGLAFWFGNARLKDELAKSQHYGQSDKKYANYDPNDYLHRLPLKSEFKG